MWDRTGLGFGRKLWKIGRSVAGNMRSSILISGEGQEGKKVRSYRFCGFSAVRNMKKESSCAGMAHGMLENYGIIKNVTLDQYGCMSFRLSRPNWST